MRDNAMLPKDLITRTGIPIRLVYLSYHTFSKSPKAYQKRAYLLWHTLASSHHYPDCYS